MANLLFAPENLTRSGLETPEGVSLHAGWYKSAPQQSLWTAWTSLARPTPPTGQQQHQSGHLMCYEGRTSSRAIDRGAVLEVARRTTGGLHSRLCLGLEVGIKHIGSVGVGTKRSRSCHLNEPTPYPMVAPNYA